MKYLYQILISIVVTIATLLGAYYFLPISIFDPLVSEQNIGTSVTTINATDTIKNSRTTINDNFTALNNGKLEASLYYATTTHSVITSIPNLASIGTIATGTWNGTKLSVSYGGTGSSTLTNGVIYASSTPNAFYAVANGSTGQLLTLAANGVPYWGTPTVDQAANYDWTGTHTFATTTFSLYPSIPTGTPTNGASAISIGYATSTFGLLTNGLSSKSATSTDFTITGAGGAEYGTSTLWAIPANTLTGKKLIKIKLFGTSASTGGKIDVKLGNTVVATLTLSNTSGSLNIYLFADNSSSAQTSMTETFLVAPSYAFSEANTSVDMTSAVNLNAVLYTAGSSNATTLSMSSVEFVNQ